MLDFTLDTCIDWIYRCTFLPQRYHYIESLLQVYIEINNLPHAGIWFQGPLQAIQMTNNEKRKREK